MVCSSQLAQPSLRNNLTKRPES